MSSRSVIVYGSMVKPNRFKSRVIRVLPEVRLVKLLSVKRSTRLGLVFIWVSRLSMSSFVVGSLSSTDANDVLDKLRGVFWNISGTRSGIADSSSVGVIVDCFNYWWAWTCVSGYFITSCGFINHWEW